MNGQDIDTLAAEMLAAQASGTLVRLPSVRYIPFGLQEAYTVGQRIVERRVARGETPVGRKIGYTNRSIWAEYGVDSPMWAHVYDTTLVRAEGGRATVDLSRMVSPRIEPEIVLGLRERPFDNGDEAALLAAVEWCALGFEIVDCHLPDWKMTIPDGIADFGLHAALVVGAPLTLDQSNPEATTELLRQVSVTLQRDGEAVATGKGDNALGSPLLALGYLIDVLEGLPDAAPLAAGEVVTTGTLTPAMPISSGATWSVTAHGLELAPVTIALT
jgi:2-oxo-3-hexenedioate decarboxylase